LGVAAPCPQRAPRRTQGPGPRAAALRVAAPRRRRHPPRTAGGRLRLRILLRTRLPVVPEPAGDDSEVLARYQDGHAEHARVLGRTAEGAPPARPPRLLPAAHDPLRAAHPRGV